MSASAPSKSDTLEFRHLAVVLSAVELHACPTPSMSAMLISEAQAHVPSSSNRVGVPVVLDLVEAGDKARITDEIAPPLMNYCNIVAVVAPADDDVVNLGELDTEKVLGKSLYARGRWRASAEEAWQPFEISSKATRLVELEPQGGRLTLSTPGASSFVLIELVRPTFVGQAQAPRAEALLDRLAGALRIYRNKESR